MCVCEQELPTDTLVRRPVLGPEWDEDRATEEFQRRLVAKTAGHAHYGHYRGYHGRYY